MRRHAFTLHRAGALASVAIGAMLAACTPTPAPSNGAEPGYVICDDTVANTTCGDTAPVIVTNTAQ